MQELKQRLRIVEWLLVVFAALSLGAMAYLILINAIDRRNWRQYFEERLETIDSHTYMGSRTPSVPPPSE